jgi:RNA polymerase sigma-70 factor (ECF subfamily)
MDAFESMLDIALMMKVREGDESAFECLHGRYQRRLLNFFFGLSRDTQTASDLCQETFLRVWKVRRRYRAFGSFPAYLFGIGRLVWCEKRREQRKAGFPIQAQEWDPEPEARPGSGYDPEWCASRSEMAAHIRSALDDLPEEQRMVFIMRTIDGLSLEDIARALDCPVNTVRSRKILAMKKVRHILARVFASAMDRMI